MNFLFFDIECAVCTPEKRICSFGYVLTDSNLNIIKKEDILINPVEFDDKILNEVINYKKEDLLKYDEFPKYYEIIKELLCDKNNIVIGQVAKNDASYLIDSVKRYNLKSIDFIFYDFAEIYKNYTNSKQYISLENERIFLGVKDNQGQLHTSVNDAYILYECFKSLYLKTNLTKASLIKKYKGIKGFVKQNELVLFDDFHSIANTIGDHSKNKEIFKTYVLNISKLENITSILLNKRINVSKEYAKAHFREMIFIAYLIKINGGTYSILNNATTYISTGENIDVLKDYPNMEIIELDKFLEMINYNKQDMNNYFDKVISNDLLIDKNLKKEKNRVISKEFKRLKNLHL